MSHPKNDDSSLWPLQVLAIDDDASVLSMLATTLPATGVQVLCAQSLPAAVSIVGVKQIDAVLLDVHLSGGPDLTAIAQLRANGLRGPIVLHTGQATRQETLLLAREGAFACVDKPALPTVLAETLMAAVQNEGGMAYRLLTLPISAWRSWTRAQTVSILSKALYHCNWDLIRFRYLCESLHRATQPNATPEAAREILVQSTKVCLATDVTDAILGLSEGRARQHVPRLTRHRTWVQTGLHFHRWARLHLIREAVRRLAGSDEHIGQISLALGFAVEGQLGRELRSTIGLSPREFRRACGCWLPDEAEVATRRLREQVHENS